MHIYLGLAQDLLASEVLCQMLPLLTWWYDQLLSSSGMEKEGGEAKEEVQRRGAEWWPRVSSKPWSHHSSHLIFSSIFFLIQGAGNGEAVKVKGLAEMDGCSLPI